MKTDISLIRETARAFGPHYAKANQAVIDKVGFQQFDWFISHVSNSFYPESVSVDYHHTIAPYNKKSNKQKMFEATESRGFVEKTENGYKITQKGKTGIESFFIETGKALSKVKALSDDDSIVLVNLLHRIVMAIGEGEKVFDNRWFNLSRSTDQGSGANANVRIDQYLTDLIRSRDDAHLAAWVPENIEGYVWEAFNFIWNGECDSVASITNRLKHRGYTEDDYGFAADELIVRRWIVENEGKLSLTDTGKELRDEIEAKTNEYFNKGWKALSEKEINQLNTLLAKLKMNLEALTLTNIVSATSDFWTTASSVSGKIYELTKDKMDAFVKENGMEKGGLVFTMMQARGFYPDSFTGEKLRERFPYSTAKLWEDRFEKLLDKEYLKKNSKEYSLSTNGLEVITNFFGIFREGLNEFELSLKELDLKSIENTLRKIVESALNNFKLSSITALERNRNLAPADDDGLLARIDQYLDDLNAFRDHSHIDAWSNYEIDPHTWEAFSALWKNTISSAQEAFEKYSFRGHTLESYQAAFKDLVERGWIKDIGNGINEITPQGIEVREEAETRTNRNFYQPWTVLQNNELVEIIENITKLEGKLHKLKEKMPT